MRANRLLVCSLALAWQSQVHTSYGPGSGQWEVAPGEAVNLSSSRLRKAARAVGHVGTMLCLSVVKDGELVVRMSMHTPKRLYAYTRLHAGRRGLQH